MNIFRKYNIITGWFVFFIATLTYILTLEPTVSWWDSGEFISCAYKLQIGHPPGAPLYLLIGRVFSLLASDVEKVAYMINLVSAFASAFTILFLFWTITHLVKKLTAGKEEFSRNQIILTIGSGMVGALAYAFSDTFWFSAVEAEVYALSSMFTAMVFWAILKWENVYDQPGANKWLILIAYLMGLSIGIHLLNLLAIPAIVLVYYYKKFPASFPGVLKAILLSFAILLFVMYGIISGLIRVGTWFEILFVNALGLPFNSGLWIFFLSLIFMIIYGISFSHRKKMPVLNLSLLCFAMILLGYSSYAVIFIRSAANPPIDENNPNNAFDMLYYLNREQYGDRPLLTGHYFDDEMKRDESGYPIIKQGDAIYRVNDEAGEYDVAYRKQSLDFAGSVKLFPRIYSREGDHIQSYKYWGMIAEGDKANFLHNLAFLINYQLGHMYFRYFMWNFAGKQNDIQSHGSIVNGNWLSGIRLIDNLRLGDQDFLPEKYKNNPSRNKYYFLPLLLGLIGLLYHSSTRKNDFRIVMALFIMTGIAIVLYLNQTPLQPRERDYAYAGSFYAFSIWIGIGVYAVYDSLKTWLKSKLAPIFTVVVCFLLVPFLMAFQNWDDHDRSGRYITRDVARNYLAACDENAILFTNGDNDTFPLWYVQEVEGFRTDVRIVNLTLLNTDWYIDQMKKKAYLSEKLPISLPRRTYLDGINNSVFMINDPRWMQLSSLINGISGNDPRFIQKSVTGESFTVIPSNKFILPIDSQMVISNGTINSNMARLIEKQILWEIPGNSMPKSSLIQLDILHSNNWERPIYFITGGNQGTLNMEDFFQQEGLTYRLIPVKTPSADKFFEPGRVDTDILYENLMNKFTWGGMERDDILIDHQTVRTFSVIKFRKSFVRLAEALIEEERPDLAEKVLDRCMELAPHHKIPFDHFVSGINFSDEEKQIGIIEAYYKCGAFEKANNLVLEFANILQEDMIFYNSLNERFRKGYQNEAMQTQNLYQQIIGLTELYQQSDME
jgi:hypothetical protein